MSRSKRVLVKFDFGAYYGRVESLIVCTTNDINSMVGKNIHFGEVAGKHSEVYGEITSDMFEIISDSSIVIDTFLGAFETAHDHEPVTLMGISPFDYDDEESEDE